MANPSDLIAHYSSKAFLTRIAALSSAGAVVGVVINRLEDPTISTLVGFALISVVISLAELNRRYTHSYLSACLAAGIYLDVDTEEGRTAAKRWRHFVDLNEKPYRSIVSRYFLSWLTYFPGLVLGEFLVLKSCWEGRIWIGFGVVAGILGLIVLVWWLYISKNIRANFSSLVSKN